MDEFLGILNSQNGTITYLALPCPLPDAWSKELQIASKQSIDALDAVERRMRGMIGVLTTRKAF